MKISVIITEQFINRVFDDQKRLEFSSYEGADPLAVAAASLADPTLTAAFFSRAELWNGLSLAETADIIRTGALARERFDKFCADRSIVIEPRGI